MLFRRSQYFPKQLFFHFLRRQLLGLLPTLILTGLFARLYLENHLSELRTPTEVVEAYDRTLLFLAMVVTALVTGFSVWTGYKFVLPLGRMLVKARSILRREYSDTADDDTDDGQGEWSDLESALRRIGRDMHKKDLSLSREREEIEAILAAIAEAVVAVDKQGNLLFYNSRFALFFGALHRRNSRLSDFFRSPDVLEAFRHAMKEGEAVAVNTRLRLKGEFASRHFSVSVSPLKMEDGTPYGTVGIFHDVSELKRMDQVRIDFVANVSHELRTPLTSIKGYAQTLKEDFPANSPSRKFLDTIERNTDRLIALVQDLLSISSLESGAELERAEVDLAELTNRVASQLLPQREAKNLNLSITIDAPDFSADPNRLEQVLFNLLENSIKYGPVNGNIWVTWRTEGMDTVLSVRDDGPGIPVELHGRIFERFFRVDSARTREQGGTGLGLSIVKHIVQRHGGRVKVQGGPGLGSEFLCYFPTEQVR